MARSSISRGTRVVIEQQYYWPDWQLNLWILVMLATGGIITGANADFVSVQNRLGLGVPWILPYSIVVGALTLAFVMVKMILIMQGRLLPGHLIIASFILFVLFVAGLVETAIQLFGPASKIDSKCSTFVTHQAYSGVSVYTLAWITQNNICSLWLAVFSFWVIGTVFILYMIVLASVIAQRGNQGP